MKPLYRILISIGTALAAMTIFHLIAIGLLGLNSPVIGAAVGVGAGFMINNSLKK